MQDFLEIVQIFLKYGDVSHPFHCEHDTLWVCGYDPNDIASEDIERLAELGFFVDDDGFKSYKYGSC